MVNGEHAEELGAQMSNKLRVKKIIKKVVTHNFDDSVKHLIDKVDRFGASWEAKHNEVIEKFNQMANSVELLKEMQQKIATFAAGEFGKLAAQQQMVVQQFGNSLEHLDMNVLATAEILREVFGQLSQVDDVLKRVSPDIEMDDEKIESLKAQATEWMREVTSAAFIVVQQRKVAEESTRKVAEESATQKIEMETIEKELAATTGIQQVLSTGGQGSDIPEGADVFGD